MTTHDLLARCHEAGIVLALDGGNLCVDAPRGALRHLDGQRQLVATAHNLYVQPESRRGLGAMLVLHAMRGEAAIFIPGAPDTVAAMYEKLRWPSIETRWFRFLSPSAAALRLGCSAACPSEVG